MRLLQDSTCLFPAALAAVFLCSAPASADVIPDSACAAAPRTAVRYYGDLSGQPEAARDGQRVLVGVDLAASPGVSVEGGTFRYRMAFNNVAEGWSWQPLANPDVEDYYRWKFLPLQSVEEERGSYEQEEKIGERQKTDIVWRYDYFLAFDNAYAFYPRLVDDDAGFVARLAADVSAVTLLAAGTLVAPALSESTTFWKAVHARPTDFTLKKRYLVVRLEELLVCDPAAGRALARIVPLADQR